MLYHAYVIVIYAGMYVGVTSNILVWRRISNNHENIAKIMSAGCRGTAKWIWRFNGGWWYVRCIGCVVWWRKVVHAVRRVCCGIICGGIFRSGDSISKMVGYMYGSRCMFSCLYLDRISDFLFIRVFCDGWVMIASFSWTQRRHFFYVLLYGGS